MLAIVDLGPKVLDLGALSSHKESILHKESSGYQTKGNTILKLLGSFTFRYRCTQTQFYKKRTKPFIKVPCE